MLARFRDVLEEHRSAGSAAGAFTCYSVSTAIGVLRAAETIRTPVILLISKASYMELGGPMLLAAVRAAADRAATPACVQLDHVADLDLMSSALADGADAIMADGSRLPYPDNATLVRNAIALTPDAGVEAELGHVEGGEDIASATAAGALTDPDEAARFVRETGVDCLAVSIGNVHGHYAEPPQLDWDRLAAVRASVDVPLSLHGASGLSDDDLRRAVATGICKVNVNTELRERVFSELEHHVPTTAPGLRLFELERSLVDGVTDVTSAKLRVLAG